MILRRIIGCVRSRQGITKVNIKSWLWCDYGLKDDDAYMFFHAFGLKLNRIADSTSFCC